MNRKEFVETISKNIELYLLTEGISIDDDVDEYDDTPIIPKKKSNWEVAIRDVLNLGTENSTIEKVMRKMIVYTSQDGKKNYIKIGPKDEEFYDTLQYLKANERGTDKWNDMIDLVNQIIHSKNKSEMKELLRIRPHAKTTKEHVKGLIHFNDMDIDSFDVIGFDSFVNLICKKIITNPRMKQRAEFEEPITFKDTKANYEAILRNEWNYEPMTDTLYLKPIIKDIKDLSDDVEDDERDCGSITDITKFPYPVDHSIKAQLDIDTRIEDKEYIKLIRDYNVWFDVYVNLNQYIKEIFSEKYRISNIEAKNIVSAEEIISNIKG